MLNINYEKKEEPHLNVDFIHNRWNYYKLPALPLSYIAPSFFKRGEIRWPKYVFIIAGCLSLYAGYYIGRLDSCEEDMTQYL